MKVLFLAKNSNLGGVVNCTANLAFGLEKNNYASVCVGINDGDGTQKKLKDKYTVYYFHFGTKNPIKIIGDYFRLSKIIKKEKIDLIHAQNRIPALFASFYCFFHRKTKYIWANHLVPIPSDFLHRITTKYGCCAVAESTDGKLLLVNSLKIPSNKVEIIHLGVDTSNFVKTSDNDQKKLRDSLGIGNNDKVIFLYGRLDPIKGHAFLLNALSKISHEFNYKVLFPGENSGYRAELEKQIFDLGLKDRVIFTGYVNGRDYLSICDLMVLPSQREGYPVSCVEAFCMGVPVIRTKTGGYEDTKDFCTGVKYNDVDSLAKAITSFLKGDPTFEQKARLALKSSEGFSIDTMSEKYYLLYKRCLND